MEECRLGREGEEGAPDDDDGDACDAQVLLCATLCVAKTSG